MPEGVGDGLPFGRSRQRAYGDITRALTRPPREDLSAAASHTENRNHDRADRRSVGGEIDLLRREITRVQKALTDLKAKRIENKSPNALPERKRWSVMDRCRPTRKCDEKDERHSLKPSLVRDMSARQLILRKPPEPATRGMAIMLLRRLDDVLPEGAIENKCAELSKMGGLGTVSGALARHASLQIDAFSDDFEIIDTAFREGARQVSAGCRDRGELLDAIRERYGELFSTMRNVCDRWQRRNESLVIELDELQGALETKENEQLALTERVARCKFEADSARRRQQVDNERADLMTKRSRARENELMMMQKIDRAEIHRLHERLKLMETQSRRDLEFAVMSMEQSLYDALNDRDNLSKRVRFLDNQLLQTRMMLPDKSCYSTTETQTLERMDGQSTYKGEAAATAGVSAEVQTDHVVISKRRRKEKASRSGMDGKDTRLHAPDLGTDADQWKREILGGFATLITSQKIGRRKPRAWVLKCIAHIYTDKLTLDSTAQMSGEDGAMCDASAQPLTNFVYDWHLHKFGLKQLAETNLHDLIASTSHHAEECGLISQFGAFCGFGAHRAHRAPVLTDSPTVTFYLRLLEALASETNLGQLFMEFGLGNDSKIDITPTMAGTLALTRALDAIKRVFTEYKDDASALKDFVGKQLGIKHATNSTTVKFASLMRGAMDEYTSRRLASLETLKALFLAADCDDDGALVRDEFAAALRLCDYKVTEQFAARAFESCATRRGDKPSELFVGVDAFIKSCLMNGMETFRVIPERPPGETAATTKMTASATSSHKNQGSSSPTAPSLSMSSNAWMALVDQHVASPEGAVAKLRALPPGVSLDRCRRQLRRLDQLRAARTDGQAAYLALKLLTNDVRTATVRAKGGFKRLGATVLHQVSFSMRAARVESDPTVVASASPDHPRDDDFDPLATS